MVMVMMMESATTTEMATAIAMVMAMARVTMMKAGCLFMCQQCAVLWQGRHLASTPMDTKESAFTSAASWG